MLKKWKDFDYNKRNPKDVLKELEELKPIIERAFSKEKIDNINRLAAVGNTTELLKITTQNIKELKEIAPLIDFDNLLISNKRRKDDIIIKWTAEMEGLILNINSAISQDDIVRDKVIGNGYETFNLNVSLEGKLNRIDILNGLPDFMKGLGLGKKVYKKLIKTYGWVSTMSMYEPSPESDAVWLSLVKDTDLYSFAAGNNLILFWHQVELDLIIKHLKLFYRNHSNNIKIDDDFLKQYNLVEEEFILLLIE